MLLEDGTVLKKHQRWLPTILATVQRHQIPSRPQRSLFARAP
jgi:hypothetical protein